MVECTLEFIDGQMVLTQPIPDVGFGQTLALLRVRYSDSPRPRSLPLPLALLNTSRTMYEYYKIMVWQYYHEYIQQTTSLKEYLKATGGVPLRDRVTEGMSAELLVTYGLQLETIYFPEFATMGTD